MASKGSLKFLLVVIGIIASAYWIVTPSASVLATRTTILPLASVGVPIRLRIPSIHVDAPIQSVGLVAGVLGVPNTPTQAAWYDKGPRPGEKGNAVIDGHYGWWGHQPAVFDDLHNLKVGDAIYVQDEKGVVIAFVVRELATFDEHAAPSRVFVSSDNASHLNLITCGGTWNSDQQSYSSRLVVFADRQ